ncbi:MAG: hypothetical protein H6696_19380 [Deferribacteres bacterium]|nr:hypothetical protein [candidate division KSB1 bacterium]MCB9504091.1 hypothetical protein [Deferribacteres bacterium]
MRKSTEAELAEAGFCSTGHFDASTLISAGELSNRLNFALSRGPDISEELSINR